MDIIRLIKRTAHRLKMYVYDVYRFIDAKIMVEKMEKDIFREIKSVKSDLQNFSDTRSAAMEKVNEGTTPTQLEEKLTEFEVTLSTDIGDELESVRQHMQTLDGRMEKTDAPEYHDRLIEQMEKAIEALENDLQRNIHILNSVMERLDRQADPQEMASEIKDFKADQESQELIDVQTHIEDAKKIFDENSLQGLGGWQKMLSPSVYRTEENRAGRERVESGPELEDSFEDDLEPEDGFDDDFETDFEENF